MNAPVRAAAGTGTACHLADPEPGSAEQSPAPSGQESYSPAAPELTLVASEATPSADSTSGGGGQVSERSNPRLGIVSSLVIELVG